MPKDKKYEDWRVEITNGKPKWIYKPTGVSYASPQDSEDFEPYEGKRDAGRRFDRKPIEETAKAMKGLDKVAFGMLAAPLAAGGIAEIGAAAAP
ncbi:hypothetical protein AGMMS50239_40380 [Bacteroidia bacterium]|nr:hypothetical protein AGMMS50239_40380 [Bacteroidia bacterium]